MLPGNDSLEGGSERHFDQDNTEQSEMSTNTILMRGEETGGAYADPARQRVLLRARPAKDWGRIPLCAEAVASRARPTAVQLLVLVTGGHGRVVLSLVPFHR